VVHTTNASTREHLWYVVAVERDGTDPWKLAYINLGGRKAAPPLQWLTNSSNGHTLRVTAQRIRGSRTSPAPPFSTR
jgi:hypothetical protein